VGRVDSHVEKRKKGASLKATGLQLKIGSATGALVRPKTASAAVADPKSQWWPLVDLVRRWMVIPATSLSCERVFSAAANISTKRRARMDPVRLELTVFLRQNRDILSSILVTDLLEKASSSRDTVVDVSNE